MKKDGKLKRLVFLILVILLVMSLIMPAFSVRAAEGYPPNFEVDAKAVYLYNMDTGVVIYEKNAHEQLPIASLTKIMTCILAMEYTDNPYDEIVTYPGYVQDWLYDYQYVQKNGAVSNADLMAGEQIPMNDALYALMLPSANEVAMSIADHIAGSQDGFAAMMNKRAKELGAKNTNFANPNGLHRDDHYSSAYDLALMTMHALELPGFTELVNTTTYMYTPNKKPGDLVWVTTNKMIVADNEYYYAPVKGIKTGSTPEAGRCFISTATKDGFTYLLVLIGAPYADKETGEILPRIASFDETRKLYEWVFDNFRVKTLVDKGKHVDDIPLRLNLDQDRLRLMTEERFTALLPKDIEASSVVFVSYIPDYIDAPVKKQDVIGEVALMLSGEEIGRVRLLAAESVDASPALVMWEKAKEVMDTFGFKFAVVLTVFLIIFYTVIMVMRNRSRRRSGFKPRRRI